MHLQKSWALQLLAGLLCASATVSATPTPTPSTAPAPQNETQPQTIQGIDLFEVHLPVAWKAAVANGVEFLFVKATEGIAYRNLRYPLQTLHASSSAPSVLRGAIHFALPSQSTGRHQADFFIEHGGNWTADGLTLPGVLEMEGNIPGKLCHGMTPLEITDWMMDFSNRYKEVTGRVPALFLSEGWWAKCAGGNETFGLEHPLWLANWADEMGALPRGWEEARFWQYSGLSRFGGEANVFFGGREELVEFALGV
ncbi:glycoside hydrolase superfamily [Aspergillus karnatakaensis]|uniref:putative secreted glycosyl hydrolase n=1 Tax=Aspergillus karnatakaensis TaxID=1810916 RepID=UPI003CCE082C